MRLRLFCVTAFFALCYLSVCGKLIDVTLLAHRGDAPAASSTPATPEGEEATDAPLAPLARRDIVDRNNELLATTLATESVFANPERITNPADVARKLARIFPELDAKSLSRRLQRESSFVWIKRNLTPVQQRQVNNLGIPGLYFQSEQKRVYPCNNLLAHVLGFVGLDQKGLAGIERYFDAALRDAKAQKEPLALSIDRRLQNIMLEEMRHEMLASSAIGATGVIVDVTNGEVLALANLPDFDPHAPSNAPEVARFNRASLGLYEMGSTFKTFTMAMALDGGVANLNSSFDATHAIQYGHAKINDAHPLNRWLTIPEIYAYSSNIGTVRVIQQVGIERQKAFLRKLGLMEPMKTELPEASAPHYPHEWREINSMTIAYGHGMSVTPLHLVRAFSAIVNGGWLRPLTFIRGGNAEKGEGERVVSEDTSREMRRLMRMVVEYGTAKKADVPGYRVGGKTGTAEKVQGSGYSHNAKLALFIATFPVDDPRYVILVMIDEPRGTKATYGFATGGWIAAPVVANVIRRMAPLYGILPHDDMPEDAVNATWVNNAIAKFAHAVSH